MIMKVFDPTAYGPKIAPLLTPAGLPELGPGSPNRSALTALAALTPESLFPLLSDRSMALGCISGLYLLHDFLDESHRISQDLSTTTGSCWHAIMHRREPDPTNSKYWWREVGKHPVFEELAIDAKELGLRLRSDHWSPFDFIDLCEKHRGTGSEEEMLLQRVQRREWELLFDWCFRRAIGTD